MKGADVPLAPAHDEQRNVAAHARGQVLHHIVAVFVEVEHEQLAVHIHRGNAIPEIVDCDRFEDCPRMSGGDTINTRESRVRRKLVLFKHSLLSLYSSIVLKEMDLMKIPY